MNRRRLASPVTDSPWTVPSRSLRACVRRAASAPASAIASCTSSCARKGTSARTICSTSSAARRPGIGRATVYRTLQWMVDAGIARKVDFGEGRSRFEPSYRHPRHFHLICTTCHSLVRVPQLRRRGAARGDRGRAQLRGDAGGRADLRHVRGVPHRHDRRRRSTARRPSWCSRATRCAWRSPPSAAASSSTRARPALTQRSRAAARSSRSWPPRSASTSARSRQRYRELARRATRSSSRGRRSCSSRAPRTACSPKGAEQLRERRRRPAGAAHRHQVRARLAPVLQEVRRAVRGLRRQADLPRVRRRGARAPRAADPRVPRAARAPGAGAAHAPRAAAQSGPVIDLHTHTTASDGRCTPAELVARAAARRRDACSASPTTTRSPAASRAAAACAARRHRVRARHRDHRRRATSATSTCSATSSTRDSPALRAFLAEQRQRRVERVAPDGRRSSTTLGMHARRRRHPAAGDRRRRASRSAGRGSRARSSPAGYVDDVERGVRPLAVARPARRSSPREGAAPDEVVRADSRRRRRRVARASRACCGATSGSPASSAAGLDAIEAYHTNHDDGGDGALPRDGAAARAGGLRRLRLPRRRVARRGAPGQRVAAAARRSTRLARAQRDPPRSHPDDEGG